MYSAQGQSCEMSGIKERRLKLKLSIPPEASNFLSNQKSDIDSLHLENLTITRQRRTLSLTRILEPSFREPFYFLYISIPNEDITANEEDAFSTRIEALVKATNKLKPSPKFIAICGGLMGSSRKTDIVDVKRTNILGEALSQLNTDIKVIFVPSNTDFNKHEKRASIEKYRSIYGEDWYNFWVCGVSFLVINSLYFQSPNDLDIETLRTEQEDWIDSELLKQQIFNAKWTIVFQDRPYICNDDDKEIGDGFRQIEKFQNSGVSHVFCRRSDDVWPNELKPDNICIIVNEPNKNNELDWCVCLVKVYEENIEHRCIPVENFPEEIQL